MSQKDVRVRVCENTSSWVKVPRQSTRYSFERWQVSLAMAFSLSFNTDIQS
ncbi:predicted protein [Sclerotinia sclerotiorum 1980 UF-70]|uniref:Uncharacterized protein n=1 Tax=Sclerotinia sclerotiorum (strain ATCC 18683 / 1980 / Ss-1) TaxID=665079 RepID=A7EGZ0_SCLS1|nr:predicted protein [Sclerotinia sclerotiorum 1980 UF-70]EDO02106.1 predicted protein [Sclerotinia sclerotiorum 1980 UF-70]